MHGAARSPLLASPHGCAAGSPWDRHHGPCVSKEPLRVAFLPPWFHDGETLSPPLPLPISPHRCTLFNPLQLSHRFIWGRKLRDLAPSVSELLAHYSCHPSPCLMQSGRVSSKQRLFPLVNILSLNSDGEGSSVHRADNQSWWAWSSPAPATTSSKNLLGSMLTGGKRRGREEQRTDAESPQGKTMCQPDIQVNWTPNSSLPSTGQVFTLAGTAEANRGAWTPATEGMHSMLQRLGVPRVPIFSKPQIRAVLENPDHRRAGNRQKNLRWKMMK